MEPNEIATAIAEACGGTVEEHLETGAWLVNCSNGLFTLWPHVDGVQFTAEFTPSRAMGIARLVGVMNGDDNKRQQAWREMAGIFEEVPNADTALLWLTGADVKDEEG